MNIKYGLDFILSHFEYPDHYFPRTVSTKATENRQAEVYSREEALEHFGKAGMQDCRISAFGRYEQEKVIPNLIFVDLDKRDVLNEVRCLFHKTIGGKPTILDTGNGYAILQPITMKSWAGIVWKTKKGQELSKLFLQWVERYLTNHKCDSGNHPSLKNTMIRIPGSYNTKLLNRGLSNEESKVTVVYGWDKKRVEIENIRIAFIRHVDDKINLEEQLKKKYSKYTNLQKIPYIEKILASNITEGRKRIFALVLCPYLMNIRKLSIDDAEKIISNCFKGHIPDSLIRCKLNEVLKKGVLPYNLKNMKENDPELYNIATQNHEDLIQK